MHEWQRAIRKAFRRPVDAVNTPAGGGKERTRTAWYQDVGQGARAKEKGG